MPTSPNPLTTNKAQMPEFAYKLYASLPYKILVIGCVGIALYEAMQMLFSHNCDIKQIVICLACFIAGIGYWLSLHIETNQRYLLMWGVMSLQIWVALAV